MEVKKLVCINCPKGCHLTCNLEDLSVEGASCEKGIEYAREELTAPKRNLTTTLALSDGMIKLNGRARLPIISKEKVDKAKLLSLCLALGNIIIDKEVKMGQVVATIENIDFLASISLKGEENA